VEQKITKLDWFPMYFQRLKASGAWKMGDSEFGWYIKLLIESADSSTPGYLPNDVRTLWRLAGARTEKFFRERGGMELVARYFSRTDDGLWIYNSRMLEVLHEQMTKLTKRRKSRLSSLSLFLQELPSCIPGEVFQEYVNMREKKKKPLTPYAMKLTITKLEKLHEEGQDVKEILDRAITNCWTGVWPIEQVANGKHNGTDVAGKTPAKSLTDPACKICGGTGWDFHDHKAFECECRRRNKANASQAGAVNGGAAERKMPDAAKASERAASAGNDGRRI
jgi:hypothetical protein